MSELHLLRALGDQLQPPPLDALRETARRRTRRRATIALVAAAVVALGLTVALSSLRGENDSPQPIGPTLDGTRRLAYAQGATMHLGDAVVTLPAAVAEIDVTDAGAVVRTRDDRIWFTDGDLLEPIGDIGDPGPAYRDRERPTYSPYGSVVAGNRGRLAAWFEFPAPASPVLVVYDTVSQEAVVDRQSLTVRRRHLGLVAVGDGNRGLLVHRSRPSRRGAERALRHRDRRPERNRARAIPGRAAGPGTAGP